MRVTVEGSGPDVVLVHGWGMNAAVWAEFATLLAREFRVHRVDWLMQGPDELDTLDAIAEVLASACVPRATVCGWSLGGQVALRWGQTRPEQVERVVLIATTPRFVRAPDWEHGMEPAVFDAFARDLTRDTDATVQRFLLLQAHGDTATREVARQLRDCIAGKDQSDVAMLSAGLHLLKDTDLRKDLPSIRQPVLILHGENDGLVPLAAGRYLQRELPNSQLQIIAGAAHAPFVSQAAKCAQHVTAFCHG